MRRLIMLLVAVICGCGSTPNVWGPPMPMAWARPGGTDMARSGDIAECQGWAGPPVLARQVEPRPGFWDGARDHRYNARVRQAQQHHQQVFAHCMAGRGYRLVGASDVVFIRAGEQPPPRSGR